MVLAVLLSVIGTCACGSFFIIWLFLVIGTLSLTACLKTQAQFHSVVLFFIVSVLGGLLFLLSRAETPLRGTVFCLSLLLKLGLFPFHFWITTVLRDLSLLFLCFFLGPAKFGLLFLLVFCQCPHFCFPLIALLFGLMVAYVSSSFSLLLYASGSCQLIWFIHLGPSYFCSFYCTYIFSLIAVASLGFRILGPIVAFLNLGGMPPYTFFWGKLIGVSILPSFWAMVLLLSSSLILFPYFRFSLTIRSNASSSFLFQCALCSASASCALFPS